MRCWVDDYANNVLVFNYILDVALYNDKFSEDTNQRIIDQSRAGLKYACVGRPREGQRLVMRSYSLDQDLNT